MSIVISKFYFLGHIVPSSLFPLFESCAFINVVFSLHDGTGLIMILMTISILTYMLIHAEFISQDLYISLYLIIYVFN